MSFYSLLWAYRIVGERMHEKLRTTAGELLQSPVSLQDCQRAHACKLLASLPLSFYSPMWTCRNVGDRTHETPYHSLPASLHSLLWTCTVVSERSQGENTIYFHNALPDKLLLYHSLPLVFSSGKAFHGWKPLKYKAFQLLFTTLPLLPLKYIYVCERFNFFSFLKINNILYR